jgi:hypothetical protein
LDDGALAVPRDAVRQTGGKPIIFSIVPISADFYPCGSVGNPAM